MAGLIERFRNRNTRCMKCQKLLVDDEKWLCGKCRIDLGIGAGATLTAILGIIAALLKHGDNDSGTSA